MDDLDTPFAEPSGLELFDGEASLAVTLTPRRALFVQEYLIDLNAARAAERCGFSASAGSTFLRDTSIAQAITQAIAQRETRTKITQDQVLYDMSLLAFSNIDHYRIDDEGQVHLTVFAPEGAMRAIQSIDRKVTVEVDRDGTVTKIYDVKLKLWDKPTPLKLMGRHVGLFPDRVEHTGLNGGPIEVVGRVERRIIDPATDTYDAVVSETQH